MNMNIKQFYDIKFPFTSNNTEGFFIDLNETLDDKVLSEILHVILTRKNTRLRKPDFGTDLIKYIFEINDSNVWEGIKEEIKTNVSKYVRNVTINDIKVIQNEENSIFLELNYTTKIGFSEENNIVGVKL